jgi:hypothetical protein
MSWQNYLPNLVEDFTDFAALRQPQIMRRVQLAVSDAKGMERGCPTRSSPNCRLSAQNSKGV